MGAEDFSGTAAEASRSRRKQRRCRLPVHHATGGDHAAVYFFLTGIFQSPSREEFRASLEDPFYEPADRLLLKRGNQITSHVLLTHRTMQLGSLAVPVSMLGWLGTAPECRYKGQGSHLLRAAEKRMAQSGALIGLVRTSIPLFFRPSGWALCGRHSHSHDDARAVLSRLIDRGLRRRPRFQIRPWKQWERAALLRLYDQNLPGTYGRLERTDAFWKWLLRRQAYDQLYVALDGPGLLDLEETETRVVGYAVTHREAIVELATAPDQRRAATELLARCCRDAIEHNRQTITVHAPPNSSIHRLFRHAGGHHCHQESDRGEVFMARLLDPLKLLRRLSGEFCRRARQAALSPPVELGLAVERKKYHLAVGDTAAKVVSRRLGRSYLRLNVADFTRLVLGQLDWDEAVADGRLVPSTALAAEIGPVLFPPLPLWRPPLDDLQA